MRHLCCSEYERIARKNKLDVIEGTRHIELHDPESNTSMYLPRHGNHGLATGTERTIQKWFLRIGIVITLIVCVAAVVIPQEYLLSLLATIK